ncbi:hypothetical protein DFH05DRAFT_1473066 [Lentinula detonsa]|uniref:Uncharacterized protein n=1 Tax=Lentinula detonsa TaxID=2804962 RepID=A0A9W8P7I5_9AGAR|nr:hypothetical protein DFH05DRAFT_1473066 [Lentinula detonsa]
MYAFTNKFSFSSIAFLALLNVVAVWDVIAGPIPSAAATRHLEARIEPAHNYVMVGYLWISKEEALKLNEHRIFTYDEERLFLPTIYANSVNPLLGQENYWECRASINDQVLADAATMGHLDFMPETISKNPSEDEKKQYLEREKKDVSEIILFYKVSESPLAKSPYYALDFAMGRIKDFPTQLSVVCTDPRANPRRAESLYSTLAQWRLWGVPGLEPKPGEKKNFTLPELSEHSSSDSD